MTREEAINKLHGLIYGVVDRQRIDDTCREVIDYLKAQEPRVMTLEEVVSHGDEESMYLEHMDGEMIVRPVVLLTSYLDFDKDCLHFAGGWRCCGSFGMNSYGKTWRCWTSRPTDEQREATPWMT